MIRIRSVLKYQLPPSSPLLQFLCVSYNNVCSLLSSVSKPTFLQSAQFTSLVSVNLCESPFLNHFVCKPTSPSKRFRFLLSNKKLLLFNEPSLCSYCDQHGPDEYSAEFEEKNLNGRNQDGLAYSKFADQYRFKAEELKKNLSRTNRLDKLFQLVYDNIDYVGRINSGVFISRLSFLTDSREKNHKRLSEKQIDFLTKLVLVNVNVLQDSNLLSLVAIILSQKLSDDHKLTITTLHEIRNRLKDFEINNLIWLWKQSGFRIKSSEKFKEWRKLREEIISVVEKKVENFHYDFQNVTEISQLSRILLTKPSSLPYFHCLLKNMTVFTESIDYGLAWTLLVQLSSPFRRIGRIESKDLEKIYNKCFQIIQDQFYENNFRMDNYVKEFFLSRMVESPNLVKLPYNQSFFQALKKLVRNNQKYLGPKELSKCLNFFGCNQYYPVDLIKNYCTWITDHPDDYLSDPDLNPTSLVKLLSESRYFETKKDQWNSFSKLLLDPVKITCLSQIDKFRLLSYLMIMNDYSHLKSFCPEFDELLENIHLKRSLLRQYLHIYAGLSKEESRLDIEGQLIKNSLDKLAKRARKSSIFIDRPNTIDDDFDKLLTNVFRDRSLYSRRVWTPTCVLLDYVFLVDKHGNFHKFQSRGRNNVAILDNLVAGLNNFHVFILFPVDDIHFCHEPSIMRGKFEFKLSMIRHHGFIPIVIDRRNWKDLTERQKITILNREIENAKSKCSELSN